MAKEITIGLGQIAIKGLVATGSPAMLVAAGVGVGVGVGIAVLGGSVAYLLVKKYEENNKKNM